jgi:hypothetical protein
MTNRLPSVLSKQQLYEAAYKQCSFFWSKDYINPKLNLRLQLNRILSDGTNEERRVRKSAIFDNLVNDWLEQANRTLDTFVVKAIPGQEYSKVTIKNLFYYNDYHYLFQIDFSYAAGLNPDEIFSVLFYGFKEYVKRYIDGWIYYFKSFVGPYEIAEW